MFQYGSRCSEMVPGDQKWVGKARTAVVVLGGLGGSRITDGPLSNTVQCEPRWFKRCRVVHDGLWSLDVSDGSQ